MKLLFAKPKGLGNLCGKKAPLIELNTNQAFAISSGHCTVTLLTTIV